MPANDLAAAARIRDLVNIDGFAEMLGVKPGTIHMYRTDDVMDIPEPDVYISGVPVWRKVTIRKWMRSQGRSIT